MVLIPIRAPESEPVSTAEAKANLRISHDGEDTLISELIRAAREQVERDTALVLTSQAWRQAQDDIPATGKIALRRNPVSEITAVIVYDADGNPQIIPPTSYKLTAEVHRAHLMLAPTARPSDISGIEIEFEAGFGTEAGAVPALLRRAIFLLIAHWYEFRAGFGARDQPVSIPLEYRRIINDFKAPRLS